VTSLPNIQRFNLNILPFISDSFWASIQEEIEIDYAIFEASEEFQNQLKAFNEFKAKKFSLSFFCNKQDNKPKPKEMTWDEFLKFCEKPEVRATKDGTLFSPATFNSTRAKQNVKSVSMIALDFDHEADWQRDLQTLRELNISYVAYTSHSHLRKTESNPKSEPRFRAVVPFTQPISTNKYAALFKLFRNITEKKIDRAASDASRMFYAPAIAREDAPYEYQVFDGEPFDWTEINLLEENEFQDKAKTTNSRIVERSENLVEPPANKLAALIENEPKFSVSWNKNRADLDDNNQSSIDMSLANYAAFYGWTDKEIISLLVKSRGDYKRNESGQIRWDYYEKYTIPEARRWAAKENEKRQNIKPQDNSIIADETIENSNPTTVEVYIEEHNDIGNARRFARKHGRDVRYCVEQKKWYVYNGQRWQVDSTLEIERRAKQTALLISAELPFADGNEELQKAIEAHAKKTKSAKGISDMLKMAQSELAIRASAFDQNKWLLNCSNGTLNLITGRLQEYKREDYITKSVNLDYDVAAECPTWLAFLKRIMNGNENLISFLRRAVGYSLTGEVNERAVFVLFGNGANGKSVFTEIILKLLGGYACVAPTSAVMKKQSGAASNDIAKLKVARFASVNETEENGRIDESAIKAMSGDDTLTARLLYSEFFEFKPEFKIWLRTNHKPTVRGTDEGIWDRLKLIPFSVRIPKHEQDKQLAKKLQNELPGILAWAVAGCLEWQRDGLGVPEEVEQSTNEYRSEQDTFSRFIDECCIVEENKWASSSDIRLEYECFCKESGEAPHFFGNAFSERLTRLGCMPKKRNGARGWSGIGLLESK
jgi:putative DNA primase/helicase